MEQSPQQATQNPCVVYGIFEGETYIPQKANPGYNAQKCAGKTDYFYLDPQLEALGGGGMGIPQVTSSQMGMIGGGTVLLLIILFLASRGRRTSRHD